MSLLAQHLVGRAHELGVVDDALAEVGGGRPVAIEVVGEPGIGKTRLLAELARRADERGHVVVTGRASELERDLPFWLFVDALDEYVQGLEPRRLAGLDQDVRAELSHVLPSLSAHPDGGAAGLQDERYRTHRAVRDLLERLAATKPLALVLDDLHWADSASMELLGALLRRPPAAGVLLALAVRPRQVPERLSAALERARRDGLLTRLELGQPTRGEAGELLGDGVDGGSATALYEESGGNPFYLEQLARSGKRGAASSPLVPEMSLGEVAVPPAVAAALIEELSLLSEGSRRVLEGAAVAGDPFEPELAAAGAAVPEASAMEALDELLRLDLVRHTDVPRRFRFRHPLVRRAVYEASPGGWRLGAHERSAGALAEQGASAAARAHHVEASARHGDTAAVAALREAGDAAAQRAPASAARWFGSALRLLPAAAPPEERVELLLARAGALAATGQFADGHAALLESIRLVPGESSALRVRLLGACAGIEHLLGRHDDAHTRLLRGLDDYRDAAERELGKLGRRIPRRTRAGARDGHGVGSLTQRELQVAQLVVDRRTNSEIAAELFLSTKTVESHLRNIFVNLGVTSRVELARVVERPGRHDRAP
jgi:predicted ATPase/DNA-binding CsgD family transcriptional regulator